MYRLSRDEREFLREEKQARQAWKKKLRKITIEHLPDLPEYQNASPLGKLRMKIYYLIVIDERGEFTIPYSSEAHDILLSIEVPQYYVTGNHEAIIDPKVFEQVQAELARRKNEKRRYSGVGVFSSRIKCGECGSWYGSKTWHSSDKYRKTVYRCNRKYDKTKGKACETPT